jgi:hypothetical protein
MSDLAEFQDVVDWVREGLGTVRFDQVRGTAKQASVRRTPTRRRRRRRVVVAISVGVIAVAAVVAPLVFLGGTPPMSPLSPSSSGPVVSTSGVPDQTTVPEDLFVSFDEAQPVDLFLSQALSSISEYREIYVGRCMAAHGFPEVLEADALVDDESSGWGEWRVESGLFGPDTMEQALQHGYLGRAWWGGGEEPPKLVSSDPEFLTAADECGQEWDSALPVAGLYLEYSGDIRNRVSEAMYRAMQGNVEVEAAAVLDEWLGCIETAGFTPEGAGISFGFGIEAEGGGGIASYFGVEVGAWEGGRDPDTTPLPAGTTEIRQGGSRGVFVPTDAEVELAMVDVACKEEVRFWQRLYPILMGIQRDAMAAIQGELLQLNPEIEALAARAQSLSEQRASAPEG